jgi:hypothetical protein
MDAPADYASAARFLTNHLPAYISYMVHTHIASGFGDKDESDRITVRTSDGVVVKGKGGDIDLHVSADHAAAGVPHVHDQPFNPACFSATGANLGTFDGHPAEVLDIKDICGRRDNDTTFSKLYVEPGSHEPIAVVAEKSTQPVEVRVEQRFMHVRDHVVPAAFLVEIKGSGFMFWLNLTVRREYTDYTFSDRAP